MKLNAVLQALEADAGLGADFEALCDCGGRRAGTASEQEALRFASGRLASSGGRMRAQPVHYAGWRLRDAALTLEDGSALACTPLLGSQGTGPSGLVAEVCDLGRGTEEDFRRHADWVRGRIALVRHEYMFSSRHIHRRRKLGWATAAGAAAFIIANPEPGGGPVTGSSGRAGGAGIPAVATDFESAARLRGQVRLEIAGEDLRAQTEVLTLDLPGRGHQWVVVSAHLDGHDLAESAMDNATGVAVALALARAFAPHVAGCERGLRVCLFSAEEWALAGSKQYVDRMSERERASIGLNINLDTVGGDSRLTALTSEFPRLDAFVRDVARQSGFALGTYLPTMANSDHFNFARYGIPALRLVAGFDEPRSNIRHVLTRGDTRDKVDPQELPGAARIAATVAWRALMLSDADLQALRER
jgi:hypothetical protein